MKLAFCLFKYFPYGGLQRDFCRILRVCKQRGHEIHVYTMKWEGERETGCHIHIVPTNGWQNHTRIQSFIDHLQNMLAKADFDLVVGFNKMPNLDLYYAADICYQSRVADQGKYFYRWLPRYKRYVTFEQQVFAAGQKTAIMLISPLQQREFTRCYQTEAHRFHLLPPGIATDRKAPPNAEEIRREKRHELGIPNDDYLLLLVGSGFKTKGLDRAMIGVAALPEAIRLRSHFYIAGHDNAAPFLKLAKRYGIQDRVHFLGGRDDVPALLLAADVLLHPAYYENTGTVLLEAACAGLPVLTVENCGYAHYIAESASGMVLSQPFQQTQFNEALQKILGTKERTLYKQNGLAFAKEADIYSMPENAANFIEIMAKKREFASTREY